MMEIPQLRAIQQLGRTYRALMAAFESRIGISMPRWRILLTLHQAGERSQKQLAGELRMDPASLTRQIKAVEGEGLVERHTDPLDNRRINVALTDAGRAIVERTLPKRNAFIETSFGDMSIEEMNELNALLLTLEARLRQE